MNRKLLQLLLAVMLLLVLGISSAYAVPANTKNTSNTISFAGLFTRTITVKYLSNDGSATGNPPTDQTKYKSGDKAKVLDKGTLSVSGKDFLGWSFVSGGTTVAVHPGDELEIKDSDIELYAVWGAATTYAVKYYVDSTLKLSETYVSGDIIELKTLQALGIELTPGQGFNGWSKVDGDYSSVIKPGTTQKVTENLTFYGATTGNTKEFTAKIIWDDDNNSRGFRPSPSEVLGLLCLNPAAPSGATVTASGTEGSTWTVTWAGLEKDKEYSLVDLKVEGYVLNRGSDPVLTYKLSVGEVDVSMWISNKKWDKHGDLIKFKAGQTVKFRIDVTNYGNEEVYRVLLYENLKGAKFKKADGYKVTSDGYAYVGALGPGETVSVFATYRVTNSDTRREKVANVVGVDWMRKDKTWGDDWDAVRIPINKNSSTSSGTTTKTPTPTATPVPISEYLVEKLLKDVTTINLAYPGSTIEVVGAEEIMTANEYATYQTLNTQDKILTVLNTVGFDRLIPVERLRLNLSVSDTALNLMSSIYARKQVMTAEERAAQQTKELLYFPKQSVTTNGYIQNYFEMALKITTNGKSRIDRYTFREETGTGQWGYVRTVTEQ